VSFLSVGERAAVTAKARVYRGRLLSPDDYLRLLEFETVGEIGAYLAKSEAYSPYISVPSPESLHRGDLEAIITSVPLLEEIPFCRYLGPERCSLLRSWGERFDVDVIKRVLRMITTGMGNREALRRRVATVPITVANGEKLLAARTLRDVLDSLRGYPLYNILSEPLKRLEKEGGTLFRPKMAMDTFFLTRILSRGGRLPGSEGQGVRQIFGTSADLINIYWIYRSRRFFSLTPEEALGMTLPVRYRLSFETLSAFAFAPDIPSMVKLIRESVYGEAFGTDHSGETTEVNEMTLEHNLYRILWKNASKIFGSGSSGVHVVLAYLTLRELEVKDLFTIIEDVRYHYDKKKAREFLIHAAAASFAGQEKEGVSPWLS